MAVAADDSLLTGEEPAPTEEEAAGATEAEPAAVAVPSFHEAYVAGSIIQLTPKYTVIVRKNIAALDTPTPSGANEAISLLEFLDAQGVLLYEQRFPLSMDDSGFNEPCSVNLSQRVIAKRPFLLLEYGCDRTAPGFHTYRLLTLDAEQRLHQVTAPLDGINGEIITPMVANPYSKHLNVRLWTGYFDLVIPFVFDPKQHALTIDYGKRYFAVEQYQPAQLRPRPEGNSAALYDKPEGKVKETVQASPTSRVKFLRAYVNGELVTEGELPWVSDVGAVKWLEIDIDGKRGWLNLDDAAALGLPESG
ncbi:MAG: hypothetical protein Q7U07_05200 [Gammaproteobacteria bacterium]|nr:hypothetical protein [Gammaproteobacteria bacterium]